MSVMKIGDLIHDGLGLYVQSNGRQFGSAPMSDQPRDPWLLTPGPLTTSATVKAAMTRDLGSRDSGFIAVNRRVR